MLLKYKCYIAETYNLHSQQADAFEGIGNCYIKMQLFEKAVFMFKHQLRIGWISKKPKIELRAYDNLGLAYYYLGDLKTALYYNTRMSKSLIEPMDSPFRKAFIYTEKKLHQRIELENRGLAAFKPILNRPRPITTLDDKIRKDILESEKALCTPEGTTPRVVQDEPWKIEGMRDLPTPRRRSMIKEDDPRLMATDENTAKSIMKQINVRVFLYNSMKMKDLKTAQTNSRNKALLRSATGTSSVILEKPKLLISHLTYSRNTKFIKNHHIVFFAKRYYFILERI